MVLISYKEFSRIKKNSDAYLLQKSQASSSDSSKGHGAVEIEEPSQLPNTEIPKQDIYQEKYAKAVIKDNGSTKENIDCLILEETTKKPKTCEVPIGKKNTEDLSDEWYYIGFPKCMESK